MKTWTVRCLLIGVALLSSSFALLRAEEAAPTNSPATRYVIGLSPFLDKAVKDDVFRRLVGFVLEDMPLGSSLALYDAYQLQSITQLDIPGVRAFRSGKTRANQFKEPIDKLRKFLATDQPRPAAAKVT